MSLLDDSYHIPEQRSPTCGPWPGTGLWPVGQQAVGMAGASAAAWVLAAPFVHARGCQHHYQRCHVCIWPACACTWALAPPLCMHPFCTCARMYVCAHACVHFPGPPFPSGPPTRKGWGALSYTVQYVNIVFRFILEKYNILFFPDVFSLLPGSFLFFTSQ